MWRGDLSPLGCVAAPDPAIVECQLTATGFMGAATQPSGDKSPRHSFCGAEGAPGIFMGRTV
ncbi:hypothetical protein FGE05_06925 [Pseudomonas sp. ICMP22404]|nr:hypothetical protein FGE05_06925 [Pseudomonas sp. ICMP22404]